MRSIHAEPPSVGTIFAAVASDDSGCGIYKCVGDGLYLEFGEVDVVTDESITLEGSSWSPIYCVAVDQAYNAHED